MNKVTRNTFLSFFLIFVVSLCLSFSTVTANAGVPNFRLTKEVDSTMFDTNTTFPFTLEDDVDGTTFSTTFSLRDGENYPGSVGGQEDIPTDTGYTLTESNPTGFIVVGIECVDVTTIPTDFTLDMVTIDNDADPSLMVDFSIMGTQEIECVVTNTDDFFTLSTILAGDGTGTVTSDPEGISCEAECSEPYPNGEMVTLTAVTDSGSEFAGFSSGTDCNGVVVDDTIELTMDQDRECVATFNDINECDTDNGGCEDVCTNTPGSFECSCDDPGFELNADGETCDDIDECVTDNGGCDDVCTNTPGSFECSCDDPGFELNADGETCDDIDACVNNPCDTTNGTCTDLPAPALDDADGRTCGCNEGFALNADGVTCDPIPEDEIDACESNPCDDNATCTDIIDGPDDETGRTCACDPGFVGNGEPGNCVIETDDSDELFEVGDESTDDDGVRFSVQTNPILPGGGTLQIDVPPGVKALFANLIPDVGNCVIVDPDASTNLVDVDIVCNIDDFPNDFDLDLGLCREDDDDEGIANLQVLISPDSSDEDFADIIEVLLNALDGCDGDGGGCSIASSNTNTASGLSNLLVMLLPAFVGIGGMFFRRRKLGVRG